MNNIVLDGQVINYNIERKNIKNFYLRVRNNQVYISAPKSADLLRLETLLQKHKRFILNRINQKKTSIYDLENLLLWGEKIDLNIIASAEIIDDKTIEKFYRKKTVEKAEELLKGLKDKINFVEVSEITLKSQLMKSRLGSCNIITKRINLNSILARFQPQYLRSVLLHEIMHLQEANHQKDFYDLLLKYEPEYKQIKSKLNKLLRNYQM